MKLDLLIKEIPEQNTRENFERIKREVEAQQILDGFWRFFEVEFPRGGTDIPIKHNLSFIPQDIIFLSVEGNYNFYFNYNLFNASNIYITTQGACRVRFLAGSYKNKAYGGSKKDFSFVPPQTGGGGSGTPWFTGAGNPTGTLGSVGDFYLNTTNKQVFLKTGPLVWTLQGDLQDSPFETTEVVLTVNEPSISATKLVYSDSATTVKYADSLLYSTSKTIGVAKNTATLGNPINIVTYGPFSDASFLWAANTPLYLGLNGNITDIPPSSGHLVFIGHSMGIGKIFIRIEETFVL